MRCGADLPLWFDPAKVTEIYDVAAEDEAYVRWLDTPCASCGSYTEGQRSEVGNFKELEPGCCQSCCQTARNNHADPLGSAQAIDSVGAVGRI